MLVLSILSINNFAQLYFEIPRMVTIYHQLTKIPYLFESLLIKASRNTYNILSDDIIIMISTSHSFNSNTWNKVYYSCSMCSSRRKRINKPWKDRTISTNHFFRHQLLMFLKFEIKVQTIPHKMYSFVQLCMRFDRFLHLQLENFKIFLALFVTSYIIELTARSNNKKWGTVEVYNNNPRVSIPCVCKMWLSHSQIKQYELIFLW